MDEVFTVRLKGPEAELFEQVFKDLSYNDCRLTRAGLIRTAVLDYCKRIKDTEDMLDIMAGEY